MIPDPSAYLRALERARAVGLAMTAEQLEEFLRILRQYADELAARTSAGLATRGERYALEQAREIIRQMSMDLTRATRNGVRITARRVAEIQARALVTLLEGTPLNGRSYFGGLGTRAAQAVLARPELAESFRSIRADSVQSVNRILRRGIVRSASSTEIARELRLHVLGADALPARLLLDRRRIGYAAIRELGYDATPENLAAVRKDAGRVAGRAQLIARTETMNAEAEATVQASLESPVVGSIHWQLSRRHEEQDACDCLADLDWYGLGAGMFDPRQCPPRPHPRCLCVLRQTLRPVAQWGAARGPLPERQVDVEEAGAAYELSPSKVAALAAALDVGEQRRERAAA